MRIFDGFRKKKSTIGKSHGKPDDLDDMYSGGDGLSIENAIVIHAELSAVGVPAEYIYITRLYGQKGDDWVFENRHCEKKMIVIMMR